MLKLNRNFLYTLLFFLYPLVISLTIPTNFSDLGIWTAQGLANLSQGKILTKDVFSILPTQLFIYPSWGISYVYGWVFNWGKPNSIAWLVVFHKIILICLSGFIFFKYIRPLKERWILKNIFFVVLFFWGTAILYVDRPALVALVPALIYFDQIHFNRKLNSKQLATLFLVVVFWVNIHGSAILALLMVFWKFSLSFFIELKIKERVLDYKSFAMAIFVTATALLLNPFGVKLFFYIYQTASVSNVRRFEEWLSPFYFKNIFHSVLYLCWFGYVLKFSWEKVKSKDISVFSSPYFFVCAMGLLSIRDTIWAYLFLLPVFLSEENSKQLNQELKKWVVGVVATVLIIMIAILNPFKRPSFVERNFDNYYGLEDNKPQVEIDIIKKLNFNGTIFGDLNSAGYLMMMLPNKIFIDARNIIYSNQAFIEYKEISMGNPSWEFLLNSHEIKMVLIDKRNVSDQLIKNLVSSNKWKIFSNRKNYLLAQKEE